MSRRCRVNRRRLLGYGSAAMGLALWPPMAQAQEQLARSGAEVPALVSFDRWIESLLAEHAIPGGQLAIARRGKVIYARGFGLADRQEQTPVQPTSLFRIASLSKPITAVAILRLVQQQKLKLEDRVDDVLQIEPHLEPGKSADERWQRITIGQLLTHTGGWDREASYDPMFAYSRVAQALGTKLPVGTAEIIRYMRGQPLDHPPGEKYAYSNFGYCLLGRVIEKLAGEGYAPFVQREVFAPLGITAPRIGGSLIDERADNEVHYYTAKDEQATPVVGPHAGDAAHPVPLSYGGWYHEALDAHGGWIASAADLVRFAAAFDTAALNSSKPLLSATLVKQMFTPQATIKPGLGYGYGWLSWTPPGEASPAQTHSGALPCTAAVLLKLRGELNFAVLLNLGQAKSGAFLARGIDSKLASLAAEVKGWPE